LGLARGDAGFIGVVSAAAGRKPGLTQPRPLQLQPARKGAGRPHGTALRGADEARTDGNRPGRRTAELGVAGVADRRTDLGGACSK